ncbi:iron-sulfur cluster repair di-iron protein [Chitinophaga pinensis]|uniref:Iron-sulfur cluster repair di-iron protein n=1 Tax=Chitinophaga pinensis TaxID=79329 RepID=A0A5C6LT54_9BACT|nr:iron-sulfur cluster repair di-iron protein [Chitinophaga pinensis]TWV98078.1 iron-sulfur cluster repair di-iron protein [Chitinophaga pinensis]
MNTITTLDVPALPPAIRHQTLIQTFEALLPGESFIIHNDHDPRPLYYELLSKKGNILTFEYLQNGPDIWRVVVKKRIQSPDQITVADIAAADYRKAEVFGKYGIDFCCGGNITLKEAAAQAGITTETLVTALEAATKNTSFHSEKNFIDQTADKLIDYIVSTHHRYVKENIPVIEQLVTKVAKVHRAEQAGLQQLETATRSFLKDLQLHLHKEEHILFPAILQLTKDPHDVSRRGLVLSAVKLMRAEHESSGEELHAFRQLTNNYTLPESACNTYAFLFNKMKEFEADLLIHIHLENNILFPKAVQLKQQLSQ